MRIGQKYGCLILKNWKLDIAERVAVTITRYKPFRKSPIAICATKNMVTLFRRTLLTPIVTKTITFVTMATNPIGILGDVHFVTKDQQTSVRLTE
jgi:hypothetical protein